MRLFVVCVSCHDNNNCGMTEWRYGNKLQSLLPGNVQRKTSKNSTADANMQLTKHSAFVNTKTWIYSILILSGIINSTGIYSVYGNMKFYKVLNMFNKKINMHLYNQASSKQVHCIIKATIKKFVKQTQTNCI